MQRIAANIAISARRCVVNFLPVTAAVLFISNLFSFVLFSNPSITDKKHIVNRKMKMVDNKRKGDY